MESPSVPLSWLCPSAASFMCSGPSCYCRGPPYPTLCRKTTAMGESEAINDFNRCQRLLKSTIPWCADWTVPGKSLTAWRSWRIGGTRPWSMKKSQVERTANYLLLRRRQNSRRQTKVLTPTICKHCCTLSFTQQTFISIQTEIQFCFHTDQRN